MRLTAEQITTALRRVIDPELRKDIVTLGQVKEYALDGETVLVNAELKSPDPSVRQAVERQIVQELMAAGAKAVKLRRPEPAADQKPEQPGIRFGHATPAAPGRPLPQVRHVIAVGAGKGGVGKSTVATNLAIGLSRTGAKVGLMDGDIYGPSIPTMLGIRGVTPTLVENKIVPIAVHGIHAITMGSLVEQDKPLIWRGPMAHGAFKQLLLDNTRWPELDYLIVDLPPGTGDVPLTLCQLLPLTGAVIVATPQQVALDDAVRAVRMFQQLNAPILGMIENMAGEIFGTGGTETAARELGLPFLGRLELTPELRKNGDAGTPHANFDGSATLRNELDSILLNLLAEIDIRAAQGAPTLEIL